MKKFYFLMSAFVLSMAMMVVSCGSDKKSGEEDENLSKEEQLVRDVEKKADAYVAAVEKGDFEAADKIEEEVEELMKNNVETLKNLDEEQQKRFRAAVKKASDAADKYSGSSSSSSDDLILSGDDDDDEEGTLVESYEYDDADYGMDEDDAASLGF